MVTPYITLKLKRNPFLNLVNLFLSDYNGNQTHNHLVRKRTLKHSTNLGKWLSVRLRAKWLWERVPLQSLKRQISRLC